LNKRINTQESTEIIIIHAPIHMDQRSTTYEQGDSVLLSMQEKGAPSFTKFANSHDLEKNQILYQKPNKKPSFVQHFQFR
jgi:hypothetical protein